MKRFVFTILFLIPTFSWAQLYIGVRTGYSPSSIIAFKPDLNATMFIGEKPDFGLVLNHYDGNWGFQGEINLTQRGYNRNLSDTVKLRQVNNYIEAPIFIQRRFKFSGVYLHATAGCYAAYLLSAKQGVDTTGTLVLNNYHLNILRDNRFDYGLIGGIGLSHEFSWGLIQIEARLLYGFADLYDYTYSGMPKQSKAIVQSIGISYMYNFSNLDQKKTQKDNL